MEKIKLLMRKIFLRHLYSKITWTAVIVTLSLAVQCGTAWPKEGNERKTKHKEAAVNQVQVRYMTLRNKSAVVSDGTFYGGLRSNLRMGTSWVEFKAISGLNEIAEASPFYLPGERITLTGIHEMSQVNFFREMETIVREDQADIVLYIHGYNTGFDKGCRQAAIFQRSLDVRQCLVLFSWPADGDLLKYTRDESDLVWSVPYLADSLLRLIRLAGVGKVNVVAHSLGARGAVMALNRMACERSDGPLLDELVLLAPDIDSDSFETAWPDIRRMAHRTTLYASANDKVLRLSQEIHGYPRLGEAGAHLTVLPGLDTIDVSLTNNRRPSGHLYHLYTSEVVSDLTVLLHTGLPAGKRSTLKPANAKGAVFWQVVPEER